MHEDASGKLLSNEKMSSITSKEIQTFRKTVRSFYQKQGRHTLPWRNTHDPYLILVSEIMLQQTQVDRVVPKYQDFVAAFPDITTLARASLAEVLRYWQGLGYNRRAKFLHQTAQMLTQANRLFPRTVSELEKLPGVGPYTARAVATFSYETRVVLIETNVRTVYLHHFFPEVHAVSDTKILELIEETLPKNDFRAWYYALMDYGAYLKKTHGNVNKRSRHYIKQSRFKGSNRELRGKVIRLLAEGSMTRVVINKKLRGHDGAHITAVLNVLQGEGLIIEKSERYQLPT